ncbi:hypothetical protein [Thermoanaerobacter uzonensis]|uniref:hypothetical protein n=1 Tax=Thermoanaerobacter uzonensis TaxID=447593 RepID=UPI003D7671FA
MSKTAKIILWVLLIYFAAILIKNWYDYRVKTIDEAIGFNLDSVYKIEILKDGQSNVTENEEKIKELTRWLREYKYRMNSHLKGRVDFSYYAINFYCHDKNGFVAFDEKDNKNIIIINGYTYEIVDGPIEDSYLQRFWQSIK